jgi:hypothetical protein
MKVHAASLTNIRANKKQRIEIESKPINTVIAKKKGAHRCAPYKWR